MPGIDGGVRAGSSFFELEADSRPEISHSGRKETAKSWGRERPPGRPSVLREKDLGARCSPDHKSRPGQLIKDCKGSTTSSECRQRPQTSSGSMCGKEDKQMGPTPHRYGELYQTLRRRADEADWIITGAEKYDFPGIREKEVVQRRGGIRGDEAISRGGEKMKG